MSKRVVVAPAPAEQRVGKPKVSSGGRGEPFDDLLARVEAKHPGIEEEIGLSSAALRAGRLVREMRLEKGLTQARLAQLLGWDQVRISNIERGEGTLGPTFDVLQKIAAVCDHEIVFRRRREKPLRYSDVLQLIAQRLAHVEPPVGTMVASPQFEAACVAFADSVGTEVQTHFTVEEPAKSATSVSGEMGDIPYVEMAAQGKRMLMLPVLVEDSDPQEDAAGADLEVKLAYPHR
jgi:transcriptional regulator with XRE-family HTH domain